VGAKTQRASKRVQLRPPASGRPPSLKLPDHDVEASAQELMVFHLLFTDCFQRQEQRHWSLFYLCGQLSNVARKTVEPMVLELLGVEAKAVRAVQRFISENTWHWEGVLERAQELVGTWLGEPEGVVIADGSGFPKQGDHSVGVAAQYCGHLGKIANCQQGVFLAYASSRGYAFLDERLYVPASWFDPAHQADRKACGVPTTLAFQTEPDLALSMIEHVVTRNHVPFHWVTADEGYGKSPGFLDGIAQLGKGYVVEVPSDTRAWAHTPKVEPPGPGLLGRPRTRPRVSPTAAPPLALPALAAGLPKFAWVRRSVRESSKGPVVAEFAALRVTPVRDALPGPRGWALFQRNLGPKREQKYYLSNAPANCTLDTLIHVSTLRWPIETAFEEGKGEAGMDQYETRTWQGWHHHMTHSLVAHLFLTRLRMLWQKKSGLHRAPSARIDRSSDRRPSPSDPRRVSDLALSAVSQSCRVSVASQASGQHASQEAFGFA
jgi:SRSO17 transposase